jgi:epoxyqueuosine reductase
MTITQNVKEIVYKNGADLFGVASIDRFENAPKGFHPRDIYSKTKSVIVFAKRLPTENLYAESVVPFSHLNNVAAHIVDTISFYISNDIETIGIKNVIIPSDDPFEYWDEETKTGRAILSLRHAGYLAGLGIIGRNNLLVNDQLGNMIQIGALLSETELDPSRIADYKTCPDNCRICLDTCPVKALDGVTVNQKACRPLSTYKNVKGFLLKKCYYCRKNCPISKGLTNKKPVL